MASVPLYTSQGTIRVGGIPPFAPHSCCQDRWAPYDGGRRDVHYIEERNSGPLPERRNGPIGWVYIIFATVNSTVTVSPKIRNFSFLGFLKTFFTHAVIIRNVDISFFPPYRYPISYDGAVTQRAPTMEVVQGPPTQSDPHR